MTNKYNKEKFIRQIERINGWSFQVDIRFNGLRITESFNESEYGSAKKAYEMARDYRDRKLYELKSNTFIKSPRMTVRELFDKMLDDSALDIETKRKFIGRFNNYIPYGDMDISDLKSAHIMKSLNDASLVASKNVTTNILTIWRHMIHYANMNDYIARDLTLGIKTPKSKIINPHKNEEISKDDLICLVYKLPHHLRRKYEKDQFPLIIWTMYYTGMRPGECMALNKSDIKNGYLSVNKEVNAKGVIRSVKTESSIRNIPIADDLRPILDKAIKLSNNDLLFPNYNGGYYNSTNLGNRLHLIAKNENIDFHLYMLRHKFSSDLIQFADPRTHKELMGHAEFSMSVEYARSNDDLKNKAVNNR